jgi:hypothetical protein
MNIYRYKIELILKEKLSLKPVLFVLNLSHG